MQQEIHDLLPDLVTVSQAAKYLGVGRKVVYQLLEYGELQGIRRDGKIFIDPGSVRHCRDKNIST